METVDIKEEFPQASLLISMFHMLQTFRQEISEPRMAGASQSTRMTCLKILSDLAYSATLMEYDRHFEWLHCVTPATVLGYFI